MRILREFNYDVSREYVRRIFVEWKVSFILKADLIGTVELETAIVYPDSQVSPSKPRDLPRIRLVDSLSGSREGEIHRRGNI